MAKLDKGRPKPNGRANVKGKAAGSAPSSKGKQRQRDEAADTEDAVEDAAAAPSIDLDKIAKKMHHALRQVHSAAKRSRQFEIQRLIKRSKAGPSSSSSSSTDPAPPVAESIEVQMHEIKSMDLNALAASALLNKLAKAKLLPKGEAAEPFKTDEALKEKAGVEEWPLLHGVWEDETLGLAWTSTRVSQSAPAEDTASKAKAKLMSNKVLAEETAKAVEALGKLVARPQGQTTTLDGAQVASTSKEQAKSKGETSSLAKAKPAETAEEPDREWSGSEDEEDDDVEGEEAGGASDDASGDKSDEEDEGLDEEAIQERVAQLGDLDQWDHLIGGSGSDEGGEDEDDEGSSDEEEDTPRAAAASSASDAKKRKRSASPEAQRKGKKKVAVAAPAPATASGSGSDASDNEDDSTSASDGESSAPSSSSSSTSSRYLPTLSHGFVTQSLRTRDDDFSGSEDEGDYDFEEDVEDHLPKGKGTKASNRAAKKNRMGQRARKALWEKKYGKNANHVKLREKEKSKGDKPAYKPLRRGRDGKVLEEFVEPERKDSGWKRSPVKDEAADKPTKASSSRSAPPPARGGHRSGAAPARPPRQQQQQRPPPPAHRPRGSAPPSAASDAAAMHPSWVAKQKQKEKEEAIARSLAGGGGGAGKKVVFD